MGRKRRFERAQDVDWSAWTQDELLAERECLVSDLGWIDGERKRVLGWVDNEEISDAIFESAWRGTERSLGIASDALQCVDAELARRASDATPPAPHPQR